MSRYVIEVIDGWTLPDMKDQRIAYVYEKAEGWPTKRQSPVISFIGNDDAQALQGVYVWMERGKPSKAEIKAGQP